MLQLKKQQFNQKEKIIVKIKSALWTSQLMNQLV